MAAAKICDWELASVVSCCLLLPRVVARSPVAYFYQVLAVLVARRGGLNLCRPLPQRRNPNTITSTQLPAAACQRCVCHNLATASACAAPVITSTAMCSFRFCLGSLAGIICLYIYLFTYILISYVYIHNTCPTSPTNSSGQQRCSVYYNLLIGI